ncbi:unnamed protein product [Rangifer tarandus platyrhynchus]|uniref:Uncharacterized protein n=1 Tax=Rangifer tarandus platyrhynchus TaxID=3082113 RepID=A0ABN8XK88_RANTA|nr:unnamed protein product [Rangifer tarandus platyrhynchus]
MYDVPVDRAARVHAESGSAYLCHPRPLFCGSCALEQPSERAHFATLLCRRLQGYLKRPPMSMYSDSALRRKLWYRQLCRIRSPFSMHVAPLGRLEPHAQRHVAPKSTASMAFDLPAAVLPSASAPKAVDY